MLGLLPVTQDEPVNPWVQEIHKDDNKQDRIDLSGKNKIQSLNNWRIANGCEAVEEAAVRAAAAATADPVEKMIGFPFEKTSIMVRENRNHYVGDSVSSDGETRLRVIGMGASPHWPSQALCELTWEFISQFARDPKTGKSYKC